MLQSTGRQESDTTERLNRKEFSASLVQAKVPFIPPSFSCLRPDYGFRLEAALRNLGQASQESQFPGT